MVDLALLRQGGGLGCWAQDDVFTEMRNALTGAGIRLSLMELCGGLSTAFIALTALGLFIDLKFYCDTNAALMYWLRKIHRNTDSIHCGSFGDMLKMILASLPL